MSIHHMQNQKINILNILGCNKPLLTAKLDFFAKALRIKQKG